jgi:nucleotide-sensitive chloride channel 1A
LQQNHYSGTTKIHQLRVGAVTASGSLGLASPQAQIGLDMGVEVVNEAPVLESFTSLAEHQEQTPSTFFGGRPVLHFHTSNASLLVPKEQLEEHVELRDLVSSDTTAETTEANGIESDEAMISNLDVWVTSQ